MAFERNEITADDINNAIHRLQKELARRVNEKGCGSFISRHEILGAVDEEVHELKHAAQAGIIDDCADELFDIAVACVFAAAGIMADKTED